MRDHHTSTLLQLLQRCLSKSYSSIYSPGDPRNAKQKYVTNKILRTDRLKPVNLRWVPVNGRLPPSFDFGDPPRHVEAKIPRFPDVFAGVSSDGQENHANETSGSSWIKMISPSFYVSHQKRFQFPHFLIVLICKDWQVPMCEDSYRFFSFSFAWKSSLKKSSQP